MSLKTLIILGSTGSIGRQTLEVVRANQNSFSIQALVAHSNVDVLYDQCVEFEPKFVFMANVKAAQELRLRLNDNGLNRITVLLEYAELLQLCESDLADTVVAAIVGAAGLMPTFTAAKSGKRILLANKESLVMAGSLLMDTVQQNGATILPVDSEHNAIFQSMPADYKPGSPSPSSVESILLTASGGPFLQLPMEQFVKVTPAQAVAHPKWSMGAKISVDSATMMNKVLEVIEAHYLFSMPADKIEVLIHPQSIVHSMVRYVDGSVIAQMGMPDMTIPIAHSLAWPARMKSCAEPLDFLQFSTLTFEKVCEQRYPCFKFIRPVLECGQSAMVALNAANEVAVSAFLKQRIAFTKVVDIIDSVLQTLSVKEVTSIDDVLHIDAAARDCAAQYLLKCESV
jgi:1-deoxy-D-xylulose-5-phosphate reductoisomerase